MKITIVSAVMLQDAINHSLIERQKKDEYWEISFSVIVKEMPIDLLSFSCSI